jgi:photosystem II stability/assembly factor-like uncharacterized protein
MGYLTRFACAALAALAVLSAASAGVNNPQSGWYSGNPLLGPNTLRDLACAGSTCYASGDFGTLLKSQDNGATWNGIVTGLTLDLPRVRLSGGSPDRVLVGGGCALRRSDDGGNTFTRLPFTARDSGCASPLVSFSFPAEKTGFLLLQGAKVLLTNDGGRSFTRRTSVPNGANDILCTSERTCFAVGLGGSGGAIMRTNDAGVSWTQVGSAGSPLTGLEQAGASTLYAVGASSAMAESVDGGLTWRSWTISGVPLRALQGIRCGDVKHCLVSTREPSGVGGPLYRTSDGGATFSAVTPSNDPTNAVEFADATHAVAAGQFGSAEVSADAGSTWASVGSRIGGSFGVLAATSETVAYAGGANGVLVRTSDGGQTWSNVSPPTEAQITGLAGSGPSRLYVLASDGTLQRSDNGGTSYSLLNPGAASALGISALDQDRLLLVGNGLVLSKDGGETFEAATGKIARAHLTTADVAPGAVIASGPLAIFKSTDRGAHWAAVKKPKRRVIADLDFVGRNIGYLLDTRGVLWKTINGGRQWKQLFVGAPGMTVEFSNHLEGYLAVSGFGSVQGGVVMRTSDGGRSWHPQLVSRSEIAELASSGPVDYVLAGESALYATTVGGDIGSASALTIDARPHALKRPGRVLVSGRLSPADGGEEIVVSSFQNGRWIHKLATAASNGTFVTRWPLRGNAVFVAQVLGDADHRGAGTKPLTVSVAH